MALVGCSSTAIPMYLLDKHPYTERFYATFDQSKAAVEQTLTDLGWQIETQSDPAVYEQSRASDPEAEQILIITQVRVTSVGVGSRYARVNVFISAKEDISEIEIRYLTISDLPVKDIRDYRNDSAVNRLFGRIRTILEGTE